MELTPINETDFGVKIDIRYATANNFTGKPVYKKPLCYLHKDAAEALHKACALAKSAGHSFRIFDAYRPTEAQWKLWEHSPNPDFLADPSKGSPHSRGVAVDLTLTDAAGNDLDMGTAFDEFTPLSHHARTDIHADAQRNRLMLLGIMSASGWDFYSKEWWHYQLFNSRNYPLVSDKEAGFGMM